MYICAVCKNHIEAGTQYLNVFDKNVCLDCAVRNTLDDVMAIFGITYTEAPDDIVVTATVDGQYIDATPEQVENFFHSENPVFTPTQVGEKIPDDCELVYADSDSGEEKPQGYIPDCPFLPCEKCHFYYGEIDSCMVGKYEYTPTEEEREKIRAAMGDEAVEDFFSQS